MQRSFTVISVVLELATCDLKRPKHCHYSFIKCSLLSVHHAIIYATRSSFHVDISENGSSARLHASFADEASCDHEFILDRWASASELELRRGERLGRWRCWQRPSMLASVRAYRVARQSDRQLDRAEGDCEYPTGIRLTQAVGLEDASVHAKRKSAFTFLAEQAGARKTPGASARG